MCQRLFYGYSVDRCAKISLPCLHVVQVPCIGISPFGRGAQQQPTFVDFTSVCSWGTIPELSMEALGGRLKSMVDFPASYVLSTKGFVVFVFSPPLARYFAMVCVMISQLAGWPIAGPKCSTQSTQGIYMGFTASSVNMTSAQCIDVPKTRDFEPMNDRKWMFCTKLRGIQHKPGLMGAEASLPQEQAKRAQHLNWMI